MNKSKSTALGYRKGVQAWAAQSGQRKYRVTVQLKRSNGQVVKQMSTTKWGGPGAAVNSRQYLRAVWVNTGTVTNTLECGTW